VTAEAVAAEAVFARLRRGCAEVTARARQVSIDSVALGELAADLVTADAPITDPVHAPLPDDAETLAFVVTLDAVNFGSGWFPSLHKPGGRSGYFTIATALRKRFEASGPYSAKALADMTPTACTRLFGQQDAGADAEELMALFARSLRDLGTWLLAGYGGRFEAAVEAAAGSAARLVDALAEMPLYRDVARYGDLEVPFFKRAQITVSDLAAAFDGRGYGRFDDLDELTMFADNLVPHVLRCEGVLNYEAALADRVDRGERLAPGSPEEVEIRAVALHAVERCVAACRSRGAETTARRLDTLLWNRGQRPEMKARPRHRARSPYY